jgi:8-oxo-dGTP pyrophosphatase MutT (NUDIX family)
MPPTLTKDRRLLGRNSVWNVYFDHVVGEGGREVPDYLVVEGIGRTSGNVTGVCVLPVVNGRFVLLRCYRHALRSDLWEAPRGFVEPGECLRRAAARELTEETNLMCAPSNLLELGVYAPEASTLAARGALFAATSCKGTLRVATDEIGLGAARLFDEGEMAELVANGAIEDAGTLIAYYRFCSFLGARTTRRE